MKRLFLMAAMGLSSVYCITSLTSCTKDKTTTITNNDTTFIVQRDTVVVVDAKNPITGTWAGTVLPNGSTIDTSIYVFYISAGNKIVTNASPSAAYAQGTWSLSGSTFTAVTVGVYGTDELKQNITATYDSTAGTLIGSYQNPGTSTYGSFSLKRVD